MLLLRQVAAQARHKAAVGRYTRTGTQGRYKVAVVHAGIRALALVMATPDGALAPYMLAPPNQSNPPSKAAEGVSEFRR